MAETLYYMWPREKGACAIYHTLRNGVRNSRIFELVFLRRGTSYTSAVNVTGKPIHWALNGCHEQDSAPPNSDARSWFGEPFKSATMVMPLIRSGDGFRDQDLLGTRHLSLICCHARTLPWSSHQSEAQITPWVETELDTILGVVLYYYLINHLQNGGLATFSRVS